jgi:GcrA cell cycle regulator
VVRRVVGPTLAPLAAITAPAGPTPAPAAARPAFRVVSTPPLMGRVSACCWPLGEPGTKSFRFCSDPSLPGKPYCEAHASLAYVKVKDRREDAA